MIELIDRKDVLGTLMKLHCQPDLGKMDGVINYYDAVYAIGHLRTMALKPEPRVEQRKGREEKAQEDTGSANKRYTCLREARRSVGLTIEQLADKAGINKNTIHNVENGFTTATLRTAQKLREALLQEGEDISIVCIRSGK